MRPLSENYCGATWSEHNFMFIMTIINFYLRASDEDRNQKASIIVHLGAFAIILNLVVCVCSESCL